MEDFRDYISLTGTVRAVIYKNPENGYAVLRLDAGGENIMAVGCLPEAAAGEMLEMMGTWTTHQTYGKQFKIEAARRSLPTDEEGIFDYLASGAVKGVGVKTAELMVNEFGSRALEVIQFYPEELSRIKGITARRAMEISTEFIRQAGLRSLMSFLGEYGINPYFAAKLYKVYGNEALEAVRADPYILTEEDCGVEFFEADAMAIKLGFGGDSPRRIEAAVLFELRHNLKNGHVFLPRGKLAAAVSGLINVPSDLADEAISRLEEGEMLILDRVAGEEAVYLERMYGAETYVAESLLRMAALPLCTEKKARSLADKIEKSLGMKYAPTQKDAIIKAAQKGVLVLTGGPGTGKTTTVKGILELFDKLELKTLLAAPTGRAAKRMGELCKMEASTIHRMLGARRSEEEELIVFDKNETDLLDCDAVILDETSMVDINLMAALMAALPPNSRLVLVGDADQLPPVGPGNVFGDIIRSGAVDVIRLTEVFRQAQESAIVKNAHRINEGEMLPMKNAGGDFFILQRREPEAIAKTVTELVSKRLPENMGIASQDIQVLSPTRKGEAGTLALNKYLQAAVNPEKNQTRVKNSPGAAFRPGDRVVQTCNNYDILWYRQKDEDTQETGVGIFNGDIGYVEDVDEDGQFMLVRFDDKTAPYPFELLSDLELAYAITVHKSQGSEYRAVIVAVPKAAPALLIRSVLYTAVTRGRELVILVGDGVNIDAMVKNDRRQRRYSGLRARLSGEA